MGRKGCVKSKFWHVTSGDNIVLFGRMVFGPIYGLLPGCRLDGVLALLWFRFLQVLLSFETG
jgi:hypothetical protein